MTFADLTLQTCISTLAIRNMIRPFANGMLSQACPMSEILGDLTAQLSELKTLKAQNAAASSSSE
jgi:adenylate cyclase